MLFLEETFRRLELFLALDCPMYTQAWHQRLALIFSYSAFVIYIFFGILTVVSIQPDRKAGVYVQPRLPFILILWTGLGATGLLQQAFSRWAPTLPHAIGTCQPPESIGRPSEEAAVILYTVTYYWLYDVINVLQEPSPRPSVSTSSATGLVATVRRYCRISPDFPSRTSVSILVYLVLGGLSLWSLVWLRIHSGVTILAGATFGVLGGTAAALAYLVYTRQPVSRLPDHRRLRLFQTVFGLGTSAVLGVLYIVQNQ